MQSSNWETSSSVDGNLELFEALQGIEESNAAVRHAKACFQRSIRQRIERLAKRAAILRLKLEADKRVYDRVQIGIIFISSVLTLIESLKVQLDVDAETRDVQRTFALLPIFLSSSVTISLSVLKFMRLQERMENATKVILKATTTQFALKRVEENLTAALTAKEVLDVYATYSAEVFDTFNDTERQIEELLMLKDFVKHSPGYHEMTLDVRRDEERFTTQCQALADGHLPEPESAPMRALRSVLPIFGGCLCGRSRRRRRRGQQEPPPPLPPPSPTAGRQMAMPDDDEIVALEVRSRFAASY